jgi:hypothetical protein
MWIKGISVNFWMLLRIIPTEQNNIINKAFMGFALSNANNKNKTINDTLKTWEWQTLKA